MHRSDIDDASPAALLHTGHQQTGGMERGAQVNGENRIPLRHREIFHRGSVLDTGIIDENIHLPELLQRGCHQCFIALGRGNVRVAEQALDAVAGFEFFRQGLSLGGVHQAVQHDIGAGIGQSIGHGIADATGGAGHQRGFSFQHTVTSQTMDGCQSDGIESGLATGLSISANYGNTQSK